MAEIQRRVAARADCTSYVLNRQLGLRGAAKVAEDAAQCASMAKEVGALQQLLLMAICDDDTVVEQACKTIGALPLCPLFHPFPPLCSAVCLSRWTGGVWYECS